LKVLAGYVITDGSKYVSDHSTTTITTDRAKAYTWSTREAAENVLYQAETRKILPLIDYHVEDAYRYITPIDEETEKVIDEIRMMFALYSSVKEGLVNLSERLSITDRKISDIEHYIEVTDQNAVNGFKLYKKIKELRIQRRNIKRLQLISKEFEKIKITTEMIDGMNELIDSFTDRMFSPKELDFNTIFDD
jgi:hypothetical protein